MWLELLATKDEAFMAFKKVKAAVEVESGHRLKAFRTDHGGEFNSGSFMVYCVEHGIKRNTTASFTPQQNGVIERRNQSIMEMARCLLKSMQVPGCFWGEAVKVAVYLLNRVPTKSLNDKTPYEAWYGRRHGVRHLRTFGCIAYAKKIGTGVNKLSDRSIPRVFLGYESGTKAYRVFDPVNNKLIVSRDVIFDEKKSWNWEEKGTRESSEPAFSVYYSDEDTVAGPTIGGDGDADSGLGSEVVTVSPGPSILAARDNDGGSPHTLAAGSN
jgi:hypothetical protein